MSTLKQSDAYQSGVQAGKARQPLSNNQYPIGRDRLLWLAGWHRGWFHSGNGAFRDASLASKCRRVERHYLDRAAQA